MKTILIAAFLFIHAVAFGQQSTYTVSTDQSTVKWLGYYLFSFGEHYGTIQITKGSLQTIDNVIASGSFEIDMKSLMDRDMPEDDGGKSLSDHLKSTDFFDVETYPTATFEITRVEKIKEARGKDPNFDITGNLTIKGVSNPLKFPAYVEVQENTIVALAKFKFDRTKWNVKYNSGKFFSDVGDGAISDAIGVELSIKAIK